MGARQGATDRVRQRAVQPPPVPRRGSQVGIGETTTRARSLAHVTQLERSFCATKMPRPTSTASTMSFFMPLTLAGSAGSVTIRVGSVGRVPGEQRPGRRRTGRTGDVRQVRRWRSFLPPDEQGDVLQRATLGVQAEEHLEKAPMMHDDRADHVPDQEGEVVSCRRRSADRSWSRPGPSHPSLKSVRQLNRRVLPHGQPTVTAAPSATQDQGVVQALAGRGPVERPGVAISGRSPHFWTEKYPGRTLRSKSCRISRKSTRPQARSRTAFYTVSRRVGQTTQAWTPSRLIGLVLVHASH